MQHASQTLEIFDYCDTRCVISSFPLFCVCLIVLIDPIAVTPAVLFVFAFTTRDFREFSTNKTTFIQPVLQALVQRQVVVGRSPRMVVK